MNFDFSDEQKLLRDVARKFLAKRCGTNVVRQVLDGDAPFDRDVWKGIVELEWPGTAVPEDYGGIGYGHVELCVLAEELGRALAPVPFSSSVYLATEALQLAGSEAQRRKYLPQLAAGEIVGTVALAEGTGAIRPSAIETSYDNGKLRGTKTPVPDGDVADLLIVAARSGESPDDVRL